MVSEQELQNNFLGNRYKFKMKGADKKEYEFELEQFCIDDLPDFIPLIDEYMQSKGNLKPEMIKNCLPWVKKAIKLTYPDWKEEVREKFIQNNIIPLIIYMFDANLMTLVNPILHEKGEEEVKAFIEQETKKREELAKNESKDNEQNSPPSG